MKTKYERDIYLLLSLHRFFSYGLAVILMEVVPLGTAKTWLFRGRERLATLLAAHKPDGGPA